MAILNDDMLKQEIYNIDLNEHFYVRRRISKAVEHTMRVNQDYDYAMQETVLMLDAFCHSVKLEEKMVKYPANWKEALKERFYSDEYKKHFPIKYVVEGFVVKDLYPNADIYEGIRDKMGRPVRISTCSLNSQWGE